MFHRDQAREFSYRGRARAVDQANHGDAAICRRRNLIGEAELDRIAVDLPIYMWQTRQKARSIIHNL